MGVLRHTGPRGIDDISGACDDYASIIDTGGKNLTYQFLECIDQNPIGNDVR